jgi:hypothetical protein
MGSVRRTLVKGLMLVAIAVTHGAASRGVEAAPAAAECGLCYSLGCPFSWEREYLCLTQCGVVDELPSCAYWGPCSSSLDGFIVCSGPMT